MTNISSSLGNKANTNTNTNTNSNSNNNGKLSTAANSTAGTTTGFTIMTADGCTHSMVVDSEGTLYDFNQTENLWGLSLSSHLTDTVASELSDGTPAVDTGKEIVSITGNDGSTHSMVISEDKAVWDYNENNEDWTQRYKSGDILSFDTKSAGATNDKNLVDFNSVQVKSATVDTVGAMNVNTFSFSGPASVLSRYKVLEPGKVAAVIDDFSTPADLDVTTPHSDVSSITGGISHGDITSSIIKSGNINTVNYNLGSSYDYSDVLKSLKGIEAENKDDVSLNDVKAINISLGGGVTLAALGLDNSGITTSTLLQNKTTILDALKSNGGDDKTAASVIEEIDRLAESGVNIFISAGNDADDVMGSVTNNDTSTVISGNTYWNGIDLSKYDTGSTKDGKIESNELYNYFSTQGHAETTALTTDITYTLTKKTKAVMSYNTTYDGVDLSAYDKNGDKRIQGSELYNYLHEKRPDVYDPNNTGKTTFTLTIDSTDPYVISRDANNHDVTAAELFKSSTEIIPDVTYFAKTFTAVSTDTTTVISNTKYFDGVDLSQYDTGTTKDGKIESSEFYQYLKAADTGSTGTATTTVASYASDATVIYQDVNNKNVTAADLYANITTTKTIDITGADLGTFNLLTLARGPENVHVVGATDSVTDTSKTPRLANAKTEQVPYDTDVYTTTQTSCITSSATTITSTKNLQAAFPNEYYYDLDGDGHADTSISNYSGSAYTVRKGSLSNTDYNPNDTLTTSTEITTKTVFNTDNTEVITTDTIVYATLTKPSGATSTQEVVRYKTSSTFATTTTHTTVTQYKAVTTGTRIADYSDNNDLVSDYENGDVTIKRIGTTKVSGKTEYIYDINADGVGDITAAPASVTSAAQVYNIGDENPDGTYDQYGYDFNGDGAVDGNGDVILDMYSSTRYSDASEMQEAYEQALAQGSFLETGTSFSSPEALKKALKKTT